MTPVPAEPLLSRCAELLQAMYEPGAVRFAFSTRVVGRGYVNDFDTPGWLRYTINTLLGLLRAEREHGLWPDTGEILERFLARHGDAVSNPGDRGLLVRLLWEAGHDSAAAATKRLLASSGPDGPLRGAPLQDRCWVALGLAAAAATSGDDALRAGAIRVIDDARADLVPPGAVLPGHSPSRWRRGMTSFGGLAYYLAAVRECADALEDDASAGRFDAALREVLRFQGPHGDWPWFLDVRRRAVLDRYEVYSVHQDAMAPLFLLPAFDSGVDAAGPALRRSLDWIYGSNELGTPMVLGDPFFIYRSIRRRERFARPRRYLRARVGGSARPARPDRLEVNRECRSYHLGWILYVWSGRRDFPEFTRHPLVAPPAEVGR